MPVIEEKDLRTLQDPRRDQTIPPADSPREELPRLERTPVVLLPAIPPAAAVAIVVADPRLQEIEPMVAKGDWDGVLKVLGPDEAAAHLPPNLGLVYALARKEKEQEKDASAKGVTELAIRCTAEVLGVSPASDVALVIAKRLLRKNPVAWRKAPAPPARISALIVLVALVLGGGIGWLVSAGYIRIRVH